VLDLLGNPAVDVVHERRIVGEYAAEIDAVVSPVALHHGRRLDVAQNPGIDLRRIEPTPIDRLECPTSHRLSVPLRQTLVAKSDSSVTVIKRPPPRVSMARRGIVQGGAVAYGVNNQRLA
jgi:hypothetical protein